MTPPAGADRPVGGRSERGAGGVPLAWALGVVVVTVPVGYLLARAALPVVHGRSFLWLAGRALGLAAYASMTLLVVLGTWLRHPARRRWPGPHPEVQLRLHAALAAATVVLLVGHVASLAADRYAGVGWIGIVVPGAATYRPGAVAVGVVAAYGLVAVVGTAALGGRIVGRHWLTVHRLVVPTFAAVWFHAVLAGTDAPRLRLVYGLSGALVVAVVLWRIVARPRRDGRRSAGAPADAASAREAGSPGVPGGAASGPGRATASVEPIALRTGGVPGTGAGADADGVRWSGGDADHPWSRAGGPDAADWRRAP